jgi:predicted ATPase/class 3 adenylate cyclase/ribosomal protein L40E
MKCPKCQFENRQEAIFCRKCGTSLKKEIICPKCRSSNPADSGFCEKCGHNLIEHPEAPPVNYNQPRSYTPKHLADKILTTRSSIEGERKLVTVLFADVANYTTISEKLDPEEVHQIMDGCFKILIDEIHKYEGTINQFTGDGIMALFGAPVAHEDHGQRACHAALSTQRAIVEYGGKIKKNCGVEFKMRIGLNSGSVIVGSIGDDLRMDYTAVGDTTNLAARMESLAKPGTVLVTGHTEKLTRDFFEFRSLGKVKVKGKEEFPEAFELLKASEVETRIEAAAARGLTKFVGRKKEIDALGEVFNKAKSGSGQVVGIVGEAGVGKSRLLIELRNILLEDEYTYLEGRCLHYGGAMPYLPILDILRSYFDIQEGDREFIIKKKMEGNILQLDEKLKSVLSPIQELLSLKVEDELYVNLEPKEKKTRTFEALRDLLVRESENSPLVLVLEDLHWIDKVSEEFLDYLIGWLSSAHIMLILLYRPEYTHQWGSKSCYSKMGVAQLSIETRGELVQAILEGGEVVPELREFILNRAGGNPLFVEELTQSLLENGTIQRKDHQHVLMRKASEIEVPDTIQGIIAARIDRVEETLKRVMKVASVIGREFTFRILQTIMGMQEELKSHLLNLQGLEFISEKRLFPELEYIFKHALTQEVAYNSLLRKRRREIHEKIGSAIESIYPNSLEEYYELLAYHYAHSENAKKAVEYLDLANQKAAKFNAMQEAKAYFDEAMKLLDTLPDNQMSQERRISLLVNQHMVFLLLFKFKEYHDLLTHYESLVVGSKNQRLVGAFHASMGACEYYFGHFDQAIQTLTRAVELAEGTGRTELAGLSYNLLQWCHICKGDFDQVLKFKEDVLRMMEQRINPRWYVWALCSASGAYYYLGRWDEALEEGKKALAVAKEYSDSSLTSHAALYISIAYTQKGDLDRAVEYGELSVQKAPTPHDRALAQSFLALAWCRAGEPRRAVEILAATVPIYRTAGFVQGEVSISSLLYEAYWRAEEHEKARQTAQDNLELSERCGMKYFIAGAHLMLGRVALESKPSEAAPHFEKSIALFREIKAENQLGRAYAGYGRFHKQQGNMTQALEYLTKALEIFERLGTMIEPDKIREELAELAKS